MAAASCWQISFADDFRHAGRLGRAEPARIRISDDAKPLNPTDEETDLGTPPGETDKASDSVERSNTSISVSNQSNAWRLRWRQPTVAATSTAKSTASVPSRHATIKSPSGTKAVLSWADSPVSERAQVQQVQYISSDPFQNPFGDDNQPVQPLPEPRETIEISQPGQSQPGLGAGSKPSTPGGSQRGGLESTPLPGTQLQPNDSRLVSGGNRPLPPSSFPTPSKDSPFPADDRPQPGEDRPAPPADDKQATPDTQPPGFDPQPNAPNVTPNLNDAVPRTFDPNEPPVPPMTQKPDEPNGVEEKKVPCDRTYNERNCCTEDKNCSTARSRVQHDLISNITLDISPSFTNTDTKISTEAQMAKTLADAPSRTWKDRQGNELAHGRIEDFRNGRVHVATDSGGVIKIPFQQLSDDDLCFFTAWWSLPTECLLGDEEFIPRNWMCSNLSWKASSLCHKPLYFEEVALERYGHSAGPFTQPVISTAHFFGSLVTLPYQMGMHPPQECQYVLGYYRPGSCAPWLVPAFPVSARGAFYEAAAIVGGIYVIP